MKARGGASPSWRAALGAALLACPLLFGACAKKAPPEDEMKTVVYMVRARILQLPRADSPASELQAHHEEIPSFLHTWPAGELGMKAMVMPFPLGEGVSIEGLAPGDAVELTFAVDYALPGGGVAGYRATKIEPLPEGTRLEIDPPANGPD